MRWLALGVAAVALLLIARMGVFMFDETRTEYSIQPDDTWRREHSCLTAYAEAARFAADGAIDIYDRKLYVEPTRHIGGLKVDAYHYPPPFLLLPGALQAITGDYLSLRPLWFVLQLGLLVFVLFAAARWFGEPERTRVLLAAPLFFVAPVTLFTLQMGNFQAIAFALSLLGMMALHAQRVRVQVAGATALAFATLGKVFPGVLGVVLLATRRWRAVLWTLAAAAALVVLTLAVYGTRPFHDFIHHALPDISSGAAFPQAEQRAIAGNQSFYGLLVKLRVLGIDALDKSTGLWLTSLYGVIVLVVAAAIGWRRRALLLSHRPTALLVWLALVNLASFRSPFVGGAYGVMGTVLLVTLALALATSRRARIGWGFCYVALVVMNMLVPTPKSTRPPDDVILLSLVGQLVALAANIVVLATRRSPRSA